MQVHKLKKNTSDNSDSSLHSKKKIIIMVKNNFILSDMSRL